jgi:hypothetical protein
VQSIKIYSSKIVIHIPEFDKVKCALTALECRIVADVLMARFLVDILHLMLGIQSCEERPGAVCQRLQREDEKQQTEDWLQNENQKRNHESQIRQHAHAAQDWNAAHFDFSVMSLLRGEDKIRLSKGHWDQKV